MPAITEATKESRKTLILYELANPDGVKDYKGIANKFHWSQELTKQAMEELALELEHINTFNRARIAIKAGPAAVDRIIDGANGEYTEPGDKLKAWDMGLRTAKALDPKLRTQEVIQRHEGNVLLTIQSNLKSLLESVEANYEVLPDSKPQPVVSEPEQASTIIGQDNTAQEVKPQ